MTISLAAMILKLAKKDVKRRLKKGFTDKRQREIEKDYKDLTGSRKENADSIYDAGAQKSKAYSHEKGVKKVDKN